MTVLHVSLFGRFDVRSGRQALVGFHSRKVQELLCYLLLFRDHPHPRESLASLLWPETHPDRSKSYLRKTLWQLQDSLHTQAGLASGHLLVIESDWVELVSNIGIWLDVAEFERAFDSVRGVPGSDLDSQQLQAMKGAVDIYRGDLLEGWYEDWCLYERERFQHMYLIMLDKLMGSCEARHNCEAGLMYGTLILRHDQARERTHRRLMRLHYLAGDRTAALRQYERCITALAHELDVTPAQRTIDLYEQIRADQLGRPAVIAQGVPKEQSPLLPSVLRGLRDLRAVLADAQCQLQRDIQVVESALKGKQ